MDWTGLWTGLCTGVWTVVEPYHSPNQENNYKAAGLGSWPIDCIDAAIGVYTIYAWPNTILPVESMSVHATVSSVSFVKSA